MHLTDFQKDIIKSILEKNVLNFQSFINTFIELQEDKIVVNTSTHFFGMLTIGSTIYIPKENPAIVVNKLKEFISLWISLERVNLIFSITVKERRYSKPLFKNPSGPFYEMESIASEFINKDIVFTPELNSFFERDFLTSIEYEVLNEKTDREKSQKLTRKIAYISILSSAGIALISAVFNYYTFTTDRYVKITNSNALEILS